MKGTIKMIDDENSVEDFEENEIDDGEVADTDEEEMNADEFGEDDDVQANDDEDADGETEESDDAEESGEQQDEGKKPKAQDKPVKPAPKNDPIDSVFAKARRESESKETERKAREQGILEATGGINPFTKEEMKDSRDIDEFLLMRKIDKSGGDPVADYSKWAKNEQREVEAVKTAEQKQLEFIENDRVAFAKANPSLDVDKLIKDKRFETFGKGRFGNEPLSEIYADFIDFVGDYEAKVEKQAQKIDAKRKASPGSLRSNSTPEVKDIETMSSKDFERMLERVKGGEKITLPK